MALLRNAEAAPRIPQGAPTRRAAWTLVDLQPKEVPGPTEPGPGMRSRDRERADVCHAARATPRIPQGATEGDAAWTLVDLQPKEVPEPTGKNPGAAGARINGERSATRTAARTPACTGSPRVPLHFPDLRILRHFPKLRRSLPFPGSLAPWKGEGNAGVSGSAGESGDQENAGKPRNS